MGEKVITFKVRDPKLIEEVDRIALIEGVGRSKIIRLALREFIKRYWHGYPTQTQTWRVKRVKLS